MEDLVKLINNKLSEKPKKIYDRYKNYHIYLDGQRYKSFQDTWLRKQHLESIKFFNISQDKIITLKDDKYKKNLAVLHNEDEVKISS